MKRYAPTSPGRRSSEMIERSALTPAGMKSKSLRVGFNRAVGRNSAGRITVRHRGGGVKRVYRIVDFTYDKRDIPAVLEALEYDPNRTAWIGLLRYADGERRYVLAPHGWSVGDRCITSERASIEIGNRLPLRAIPVGTRVFNIELAPGRGAQLVRSAGVGAEVLAIEGSWAQLRLPSGEVRLIPAASAATIGGLSNPEHTLMSWGTAGRSRRRGIRPTVRGSAMNPRDHPYGGGEGRALRGTRRPKTAWGKITGGVKTRRTKASDRLILGPRAR